MAAHQGRGVGVSDQVRAPLALVAAVAKNGIIGKDGQLPWRIPEDLKHFRRLTTGHAIIMGRRTWDEVGKPLPNRRNIVVTRQENLVLAGAEVVRTLEEAIALARQTDAMPFIIGGAQIYREALPHITHLYLTEIDRAVDGDTHFPEFDRNAFQETERRTGEEKDVVFVTLER